MGILGAMQAIVVTLGRLILTISFLLLYVNDMLVDNVDFDEINKLKKYLSNEFEMKDLGVANQILGMRISRDKEMGTLQLCQAEYIHKVLQRFSASDAKAI